MTQHAELFSPSKAARRLACPGSARMERGLVDTPSQYAEEGSAAHHLAQVCLEKGENAAKYKGRRLVRVGRDFSMLQAGTKRNDGWEINTEMVEAVQTYLDYVRNRPAGGTAMVETRVTITPECFGTADFIYAVPFGALYVDDYKHGVGVTVSPEWNPQALSYALGAVYASPYDHDLVHVSIIQPRTREGERIKSWNLPVAKLYEWRDTVLLPGIERCKLPDAPLSAGSHCKFCKAYGGCPEVNKDVMAVAPMQSPTGLPVPAMMSNEQIAQVLNKMDMAESWLKEVAALALRKAENGEEIPGYKIVAGRNSRDWTDPSQAETFLESVLADRAYERKLLTPAKAEKAFKECALDGKQLAPLITSTSGKPTLAPTGDKRLALPPQAQRVFAPITTNADFG